MKITRNTLNSLLVIALSVTTLGPDAGGAENWRVPDATARVSFTIHTGFYPRHDEVIEVPLADLPKGTARVFMDQELPSSRDQSMGVLRFLLRGRIGAYEELPLTAYFGGAKEPQARSDPRLTNPRFRSLIRNGNFENDLEGWTVPADQNMKVAVVSDEPHTGKECLRLDFDGKSGSVESNEFPVVPHTLLTFRAWARVTSFQRPKPHVGAPVRVLVQLYDDAGEMVDRFSSSWSTADFGKEWRIIHAWHHVPATARSGRVHIRNWWCKATAFVDDISVYVFQPPPCEVRLVEVHEHRDARPSGEGEHR